MPCPSIRDLITSIVFGDEWELTKILIVLYPPLHRYFISLGPRYFPLHQIVERLVYVPPLMLEPVAADRLLPRRVEVKNEWSCAFTLYAGTTACLSAVCM
jgi:hypothetical protein